MCDILQSQRVGDHTSISLKRLVACIQAPPLMANTVSCECLEPTLAAPQSHTTPTTTTALLTRVACQPQTITNPGSAQVCNTDINTQGTLVLGGIVLTTNSPNQLVTQRFLPTQTKIDLLCRSNRRPPSSTQTARIRYQAEAAIVHPVYQRPNAALPPCPLPAGPQPGVPTAQVHVCRI